MRPELSQKAGVTRAKIPIDRPHPPGFLGDAAAALYPSAGTLLNETLLVIVHRYSKRLFKFVRQELVYGEPATGPGRGRRTRQIK
jgi:hypothetical protein